MIDRNLYIDLLSGYIMSNTEHPTRPSISGEPAGRVFIQTGEKNMNNTRMKPDGYEAEYDSDKLKAMGICAVCTVESWTVKIHAGDFEGYFACIDCAEQAVD